MRTTPHPFVIADNGADVDWTHPTNCPQGERCEIARRAHEMPLHAMAALAEGRPDGTYLLGLLGFRGLCLIDAKGSMLPAVEPYPTAC